MRSSLLQDLLYVIAYGPSQVKPPAVQMLFHYWPNLKPPGAISEYRGLQYTGKKSAPWWPVLISPGPPVPCPMLKRPYMLDMVMSPF